MNFINEEFNLRIFNIDKYLGEDYEVIKGKHYYRFLTKNNKIALDVFINEMTIDFKSNDLVYIDSNVWHDYTRFYLHNHIRVYAFGKSNVDIRETGGYVYAYDEATVELTTYDTIYVYSRDVAIVTEYVTDKPEIIDYT